MRTHTGPDGRITCYTDEGSGSPLLLLHGGFGHGGDFDDAVANYSERHRVLRPDRRGHGRTPDVPGPITHELMAADTIALLNDLVGGPSDLLGYSDGGAVALHVALRRPDLVRHLVCVSGQFHADGLVAGLVDDSAETLESLQESPMADTHAALSPDGAEHFPVVAHKLLDMTLNEPRLTVTDLAEIRARTLIIAADHDIVTLEHTIALYRAISDAELAVIPGTTHALLEEKPELIHAMVHAFLRHEPVQLAV